MIELQVTPAFIAALLGLLTFGGTLVAWLVRLERRFNSTLTKEEHKVICEERENDMLERICDLKEHVTDFKREMKVANEYSSTQRHLMRDIMQKMTIEMTKISTKLDKM